MSKCLTLKQLKHYEKTKFNYRISTIFLLVMILAELFWFVGGIAYLNYISPSTKIIDVKSYVGENLLQNIVGVLFTLLFVVSILWYMDCKKEWTKLR